MKQADGGEGGVGRRLVFHCHTSSSVFFRQQTQMPTIPGDLPGALVLLMQRNYSRIQLACKKATSSASKADKSDDDGLFMRFFVVYINSVLEKTDLDSRFVLHFGLPPLLLIPHPLMNIVVV